MTMPNLFVVGAMKAGTTTVYHYLRQHPEIFMSRVKEPQFFLTAPEGGWRGPDASNTSHHTLADYAGFFEGASAKVRGEASPVYLCDPHAPAAIQQQAPDARIIAILRQPVDRAYSCYLMKRRQGLEPLDFEDALEEEPHRIAQGWRYAWHYAALGRYGSQLDRYRRVFGADRVKIMFYDDLASDPRAFMRELFRFLAVSDSFDLTLAVDRNTGHAVRSTRVSQWMTTRSGVREAVKAVLPAARPLWRATKKVLRGLNNTPAPTLDPTIRRRLTNEWRADIDAVEALTGRRLDHWRDASR